LKKLIRSQASLVEEVETVAFGSLGGDSSYGLRELRASQVETNWIFVGSLLHYSIFGILFGFLVEEVDSLAGFAS